MNCFLGQSKKLHKVSEGRWILSPVVQGFRGFGYRFSEVDFGLVWKKEGFESAWGQRDADSRAVTCGGGGAAMGGGDSDNFDPCCSG
ncbi:hypothetical protein F0562_013698 [Nyssa sinensis]|uniref:Uncharacterized protein n=1 Tax=Nyssa sinensis TaxID=561372 RepID=A0A5J4ZQK2_9ASTE|nr:hypothetical protein F0562_013698 [Nyssa sinensis]